MTPFGILIALFYAGIALSALGGLGRSARYAPEPGLGSHDGERHATDAAPVDPLRSSHSTGTTA